LVRSQQEQTRFALLVCDLNDFKKVNDRMGHMDGNRVLKAVAEALQKRCREYDHVARMGGDEFVLVLPAVSPDEISQRINLIKDKVRESGDGVSIAIGAAFYPEDGEGAEDLMVVADMRMYEDKRSHANRSRSEAQSTATLARG
jgi:diguanylate cyclase (GGDEF)-like protein